ncbi:hypothetical protein CNO08_03120 [Lysobacter capsici]|nr:hypothetical protein CNO08_03120 [Lysobacter capsici]
MLGLAWFGLRRHRHEFYFVPDAIDPPQLAPFAQTTQVGLQPESIRLHSLAVLSPQSRAKADR